MTAAGGLSGALAASLAGALVTASDSDWLGDGTRMPSTMIAAVTPRATVTRTRAAPLNRRGAMNGIGRVDDNKRWRSASVGSTIALATC